MKFVMCDSILVLAPPDSGWKRSLVAAAVANRNVARERTDLVAASASLFVCKDDRQIDSFLLEAMRLDVKPQDICILREETLPKVSDLAKKMVVVSQADLAKIEKASRRRQKEIRKTWCTPSDHVFVEVACDDEDIRAIENEELKQVARQAVLRSLQKFEGEILPMDLVRWSNVFLVGAEPEPRIRQLVVGDAYVHVVKINSEAVPAEIIKNLFPEKKLVKFDSWLHSPFVVCHGKPKAVVSIQTLQTQEQNEMQTKAYDLFRGTPREAEKFLDVDVGMLDDRTRRAVLGLKVAPRDCHDQMKLANDSPKLTREEVEAAVCKELEQENACELCKEECNDAVLECGHFLCRECADECARNGDSCWRCGHKIDKLSIVPFASKSGILRQSRKPDCQTFLLLETFLDHVASLKRHQSYSSTRILVLCARDKHVQHITKNLMAVSKRAKTMLRNQSLFVGGKPPADDSDVLHVCSLQSAPAKVLSCADIVILVHSALSRRQLRKLRDSVGGMSRFDRHREVEIVEVCPSVARAMPPSARSFLSGAV